MPRVTDLRRALDRSEIVYIENKIQKLTEIVKIYKDTIRTTIIYKKLKIWNWFVIVGKDEIGSSPLLDLGDNGHPNDDAASCWSSDTCTEAGTVSRAQ